MVLEVGEDAAEDEGGGEEAAEEDRSRGTRGHDLKQDIFSD